MEWGSDDMTETDDSEYDDNRDNLNPEYGIHLHDPRIDGVYGGPRISSPARSVPCR